MKTFTLGIVLLFSSLCVEAHPKKEMDRIAEQIHKIEVEDKEFNKSLHNVTERVNKLELSNDLFSGYQDKILSERNRVYCC